MKRWFENYTSLILLAALVLVNSAFSFPSDQMYVMFGALLILSEAIQWGILRRKTTSHDLIRIRSMEWMWAMAGSFIMIYWMQSRSSGLFFWIAVGLVVCYFISYAYRRRHYLYRIDEQGIKGINEGLSLDLEEIREFHIQDEAISFDSMSAINEFEIERKRLVSPVWEELISHIKSTFAAKR